jgi:hypothetical protein
MQAMGEHGGGRSVCDEIVLRSLRSDDGTKRTQDVQLRRPGVLHASARRHDTRGHASIAHVVQMSSGLVPGRRVSHSLNLLDCAGKEGPLAVFGSSPRL